MTVLPWCRAETCFKYVAALVSFGEGATKQPIYVWIDRAIPRSLSTKQRLTSLWEACKVQSA